MDSLERVTGSAADLMAATLLSTPTPAGSRRGSAAARSFRALRQAFGVKEDDEEKGEEKALRYDEKEVDEKYNCSTAYPGLLAPISPCARHEEVLRSVSPTTPLMADSAARGATGLLTPRRPAHYRAASSSWFYGPTPPTPRPSPRLVALPHSPDKFASPFADSHVVDTPASTAAAFAAFVDQQGRTARELLREKQASSLMQMPPSPAIPPRTPTPTLRAERPLLTQLNRSPRPFTGLRQVDLAEADPLADSSPLDTPSPLLWVDQRPQAPASSVAVRQTETVETGPYSADAVADDELTLPSAFGAASNADKLVAH
ncbi:hypothetical protein JCM10295v2_002234 [Rhodotorula toruloides]